MTTENNIKLPIDLGSKTGRKTWLQIALAQNGKAEKWIEKADWATCMRSGKSSPFCYRKNPIYTKRLSEGVYLVILEDKGRFYEVWTDTFIFCEDGVIFDDISINRREIKKDRDKLLAFRCGKKILLDGDFRDRENPLVEEQAEMDLKDLFPIISISCLIEMFNAGPGITTAHQKIMDMFEENDFKLMDSTPEKIIELTKKQKEQYKVYKKGKRKTLPKPPKPGLTLIGGNRLDKVQWHQAGAVLLKHKNGTRYLFGADLDADDDSQYYGIQLAGKPNTIADAYLDLIPKEIRGINCERQGEWFVVPIDKSEVPSPGWNTIECEEIIILPREDMSSNEHTIHGYTCIVDGVVYATRHAILSHPQHRDITFKTWVKLLRNTAVKSVSVEGVD